MVANVEQYHEEESENYEVENFKHMLVMDINVFVNWVEIYKLEKYHCIIILYSGCPAFKRISYDHIQIIKYQ